MTTLPLRAYHHPNAGFRLPLPHEWELVEDTQGVALIAVEPDRGSGWFRANLVVTIEQLDPPGDLAAWQDQALGIMRQGLAEFILIDLEECQLAGRPARRMLAHHRTETAAAAAAVTMEQWTVVEGLLGYTLTTSVAALEYNDLADTFAQLAGEFRPDPEFTP